MRLGFDVDEVVANLSSEFEKFLLETHNIEWPIGCFSYYDFNKCALHEDPEMNRKIADDLHVIAHDADFLFGAKPHKDALAFLRKAKKNGHTLHYITNRPLDVKEKTVEWFRVNKIPFDTVDVIGHTNMEKGMVGRALNLDFYLDDLEEHLESMYKHKSRWYKGLGLFTRPWNKDSIDGSRFLRFNNWEEVERHLGIHKR